MRIALFSPDQNQIDGRYSRAGQRIESKGVFEEVDDAIGIRIVELGVRQVTGFSLSTQAGNSVAPFSKKVGNRFARHFNEEALKVAQI